MDPTVIVITLVASYLIGSISFARVVARIVDPSLDLENVVLTQEPGGESHRLQTVGATTASIKLGPRIGCTIGILDILKGVVPVLIFRLVFPDQAYQLIAACAVVIGHNWPVFYRFRGGGGISPTYGGLLVVDFFGTIISALAGLIFGFLIVRDVLVSYVAGLWFMLVWLILFNGDVPHILYGIAINVIFTLALIPDAKKYYRQKRDGKVDMSTSLETFPMGRGMLKIMRFLGAKPR